MFIFVTLLDAFALQRLTCLYQEVINYRGIGHLHMLDRYSGMNCPQKYSKCLYVRYKMSNFLTPSFLFLPFIRPFPLFTPGQGGREAVWLLSLDLPPEGAAGRGSGQPLCLCYAQRQARTLSDEGDYSQRRRQSKVPILFFPIAVSSEV